MYWVCVLGGGCRSPDESRSASDYCVQFARVITEKKDWVFTGTKLRVAGQVGVKKIGDWIITGTSGSKKDWGLDYWILTLLLYSIFIL